MKPIFQTDRDDCGDRYLGSYLGCDLYVTDAANSGALGQGIIARYGNEGHEYTSSPASLLRDQLLGGGTILLCSENLSMPYREYVFSGRQGSHCRVLVLGLLLLDAETVSGNPIVV